MERPLGGGVELVLVALGGGGERGECEHEPTEEEREPLHVARLRPEVDEQ